MAREAMAAHGLSQWEFVYDHARRRFGSCQPGRRRITLSKHLTFLNNRDAVRETVLHEIAHALTPGDGHGPKWRAKCVELGIRPERCYTDERVTSPPRRPARWQIGCKACDWWAERYKVTRRKLICKRCRTVVVYREKISGVEVQAGG